MDSALLLPLLLCRTPGLSLREKTAALKRAGEFDKEGRLFVSSTEEFCGLLEGLGLLKRLTERPDWSIEAVRNQVEKDALAMERGAVGLLTIVSPEYPPQLREIFDPPAALFYRGHLPPQDRPLAAVVGTRKPGAAALSETYRVSRELAQGGVPVVSGLALGHDAMAHRGCLDGGGFAAGVLGSGLDMVYPASNRGLARRIIENGGCLLSEYPPGTPPLKHHFPARNRIIAGLCRGTVVAEAPASSGALITGAFALEQGRDLWVLSAGVASPRGEGTRKLAEDGARVISSGAEILEEWGMGNRE